VDEKKTLKVQKIKNGIVIDHIPCGRALKVLKILNIEGDIGSSVSIAMHVRSRYGWKDIVKIEDRYLEEKELDKIALVAPTATVNIIKNYEVVKKHKVQVPDKIVGIVRCTNPRCITNQNEPLTPEFYVISKEPLIIKCKYCERDMESEEIIENII